MSVKDLNAVKTQEQGVNYVTSKWESPDASSSAGYGPAPFSSTPITLTQKLNNLADVAAGQIDVTSLQPEEMRIGHITLTVPPENIEISDSRTVQAIPGLRTNTESLIKTGRGELVIQMLVRFPTPGDINYKLRPLIALLRSTPFITITSDFVANSIFKRWITGMSDAKLKDMASKLEQIKNQFNRKLGELKPKFKPAMLAKIPTPDFSGLTPYNVVKIEKAKDDGDTIRVNLDGAETTIRFIGVNTAESGLNNTIATEDGLRAAEYTKNLLDGEQVYLLYEHDGPERLDIYGRTLAYLYRVRDGLFINADIVINGIGPAYIRFPFKYSAEFQQFEKHSQWAGIKMPTFESGMPEPGYNLSTVLKEAYEAYKDANKGASQMILQTAVNDLALLRALAAEYAQLLDNIKAVETLRAMENVPSPIVPVVFASIEYGPDRSSKGEVIKNAMRATLTFGYFNHGPFSPRFEFRDHKGMPTTDMRRCTPLLSYVNSRFINNAPDTAVLSVEKYNDYSDKPLAYYTTDERLSGSLGFRFPTARLERVPKSDTTDSFLNPMREVSTERSKEYFPRRFSVPLIERTDASYINIYEDLIFASDSENVIIEDISVRISNRLAAQPVQGGLHPAYQFMGGANARISIQMNIVGSGPDPRNMHDQALRKILYMKTESEDVALRGPRQRRHHKIFIASNITGIAGIYAASLSDLRITAPPPGRQGGPYQTTVQMDMVEFRASQESREILTGSIFGSRNELVEALVFATKKYYGGYGDKPPKAYGDKPNITDMVDRLGSWEDEKGERYTLAGQGFTINDILGKHLYGTSTGKSIDVKALNYRTSAMFDFESAAEPTLAGAPVAEGTIILADVNRASPSDIDQMIAGGYLAYALFGHHTKGGVPITDPSKIPMFYKWAVPSELRYIPDEWKDEPPAVEMGTKYPREGFSLHAKASLYWTGKAKKRLDEERKQYHNRQASADPERYDIPGIFDTEHVLPVLNVPEKNVPDIVARMIIGYWAAKGTGTGLLLAMKPPQGYEGESPYPRREFINRYVDTVLATELDMEPVQARVRAHKDIPYRTNPRINIRERVLLLSRWMMKNIPEYAELLASRQKDHPNKSAYPDLSLPTYGIAFEHAFSALKAAKNAGNLDSYDPKNLDALDDEGKRWLHAFVPTYSDLGIHPPPGKKKTDFARGMGDVVDPDFFWYHYPMGLITNEMSSAYQKTFSTTSPREITDEDKLRGTAWDNSRTVNAHKLNRLASENMEKNSDKRERDGHTTYLGNIENPPISSAIKDETEIRSANAKPGQDYCMANAALGGEFPPFDPNSKGYNLSLHKRLQSELKDDVWRMVNAYPAFQLYFMEQDNEQWTLLDDIYGYTSVIEFHVYQHKHRPWVADISLINTSGNLDEAIAGRVSAKRRQYSEVSGTTKAAAAILGTISGENPISILRRYRNDDEFLLRAARYIDPNYDKEPGTYEDLTIDHAFIGPGTMIALKAGYSSKPSELETIFVGQIAEIQRGDVIKIVAQDYMTELTPSLDTKDASEIDNSIANKVVGWKGADAVTVINYVMKKSPSKHFGQLDIYSLLSYVRSMTESDFFGRSEFWPDASGRRPTLSLARAELSESNFQLNSIGGYWRLPDTALNDRKIENVFYPRNTALYRYFFGEKWVIPHKTGIETLYEVSRHAPGWIYAARPYDLNGMTLFFGKPGHPYFYTAWGKSVEKTWRTNLHEERKKAAKPFTELIKDWQKWHTSSDRYTERIQGRISAYYYKEHGDYLSGRRESALPHLEKIESLLGSTGLKIACRWLFNKYDKRVKDRIEVYKRAHETLSNKFYNELDTFTQYQTSEEEYSKAIDDAWKEYKIAESSVSAGGMILAMSDWHDHLAMLASNQPADTVRNAIGAIKEAHVMDIPLPSLRDVIGLPARLMTEAYAKELTALGEQVKKSVYNKAVDEVMSLRNNLRAFLFSFSVFLSETMSVDSKASHDMINASLDAEYYEFSPRTKPFRNYHGAVSNWNIIHNGIKASVDQMDNAVKVSYPEGDTKIAKQMMAGQGEPTFMYQVTNEKYAEFNLPFDKDLPVGQRRLRSVTEINANNIAAAERCAYSNLADAIRPVYRGNLILRGNERIHPWDIIAVNDSYNQMTGPIEVEQVIHHFTPDMGFVTEVTPHLVVIPNSQSDWWHCFYNGLLWAGVGIAMKGAAIFGGIAMLATSLLLAPVAVPLMIWGPSVADWIVDSYTGTSIWGNVKGRGNFGDRTHPMDIIPLTVQGYPYLAGLQRQYRNAFLARVSGQWKSLKGLYSNAMYIVDNLGAGRPTEPGSTGDR